MALNDLKVRIHSDDPRLKRHINHDSRSGLYPLPTAGLTVTDAEWAMHIATMNQLATGKCTAEAATETLASDPFWSTLTAEQQGALNDRWSDAFYSDEESLDGDGPYPPNDNGSSGLTSAKVAKNLGLISGYQHTFTADDALKGLSVGPASWGTLWKTGMDDVNTTTGQVKYSGTTRGGHELCLYKVVANLEQLWFRQSWGPWGYQNLGLGWISFADFEKSLADQGDVTFFTPLTKPTPTPAPQPPAPASDADYTFMSTATLCTRLSRPYKTWKAAKGFSAHVAEHEAR